MGTGLEAKITLQGGGVRIGHRHIPWLHGNQLFVGLKVVILRQNTSAHQLFAENLYEVQKVFRLVVPNVVNGVGRDRQAVFPIHLLRGLLHHPDYTLHNVVHIGEIPLAVSIVEDLNSFAF